MSVDPKRFDKAVENLNKFLDYAEWLGRIPSAKGAEAFERRMSYWLIHMKQARNNQGTCIWYPELDEIANGRGYPDLFQVDTRMIRNFHVVGQTIGGWVVTEKLSELSEWGQNILLCNDESARSYKCTYYELSRMRDSIDWKKIASSCRKFFGKEVGCWTLMAYHGQKGVYGTEWFARRTEKGVDIVEKIVLPSISALKGYFEAVKGEKPSSSDIFGEQVEDMTGKVINDWTVIGFSHKVKRDEESGVLGNKECVWHCICKCGTISTVTGGKLRAGKSKSCGCYRSAVLSENQKRIIKQRAEA